MEIIHIVLGKANPERMNGVNKVVYQLASKQKEHGIKVSVWGITKDLSRNFGERNFNTFLFKQANNPFIIDEQLKEQLKRKKEKVIFHLHGGWIPVFYSIATLLHEQQIPFVFTPHGAYNTIAMNKSKALKDIYFKLFENKVLKYAKKIHCLGQSETEGLNSIYPNNKTILLPYGFEQKSIAVKPLNPDQLILGFVGRLDIYTKGLDLLVEAFKEFQKKNENACLWIIGDGPEKEKLKQIIEEKNLSDKVELFGSKFAQEKEQLIQKMDVFVHPSRNEGLPSSVIEASHFGVPCIVSYATNFQKYIEQYDAGLLVKDDNSDSLKQAIEKMYSMWKNKSLLKMKFNAQHMVQHCFNWSKLINDYNSLYELRA